MPYLDQASRGRGRQEAVPGFLDMCIMSSSRFRGEEQCFIFFFMKSCLRDMSQLFRLTFQPQSIGEASLGRRDGTMGEEDFL